MKQNGENVMVAFKALGLVDKHKKQNESHPLMYIQLSHIFTTKLCIPEAFHEHIDSFGAFPYFDGGALAELGPCRPCRLFMRFME
jgi:hypothetical protein